MHTRLRQSIVGATACVLATVGSAAPSSADTTPPRNTTAQQTISVSRPAGQIAVADATVVDGYLHLTIVDTRADDPGWSVTVSRGGSRTTVSSAAPGHGLGITTIVTELPDGDERVTITLS